MITDCRVQQVCYYFWVKITRSLMFRCHCLMTNLLETFDSCAKTRFIVNDTNRSWWYLYQNCRGLCVVECFCWLQKINKSGLAFLDSFNVGDISSLFSGNYIRICFRGPLTYILKHIQLVQHVTFAMEIERRFMLCSQIWAIK